MVLKFESVDPCMTIKMKDIELYVPEMLFVMQRIIGHFRVAFNLCFKARLSAKPSISK